MKNLDHILVWERGNAQRRQHLLPALTAIALTVVLMFSAVGVVFAASGGMLEVKDGTTVTVSATQVYQKVIIGANAADDLTAAGGKLLTLTVDGVECKIRDDATYESAKPDGVVLTATDWFASEKLGSQDGMGRITPEAYRAALFFQNGAIVPTKSVETAAIGGTYGTDLVEGVSITAGTDAKNEPSSPQFGGIYVIGNNGEPLLIKDAKIELLSDSQGRYNKEDSSKSESNDFVALGSGVAMFPGANVTLENVDIHTTGVAKPALYSDGAQMLFKNSKFFVEGGTLYDGYINSAAMAYMVAPPWVLGIAGNARGTNLVGDNTVNVFLDSEMKAAGWGVLSSDSGSDGVISVINSDVTMTGGTGYGIYVIGGVLETYYGSSFDVGTYAVIGTGGKAVFTSLEEGQKIDVPASAVSTDLAYDDLVSTYSGSSKPTTVSSQFGVMAHNSTDFVLEKGTVFNTKNASFLMKSGADTITVDGSELNPEDGIILQVIDNDDSVVGVAGKNPEMMPDFNTAFYEKAGWPEAVTQADRDSAPAPADPGGEGAPEAEVGAPEGEGGGPPAGDPPSVTAVFTNVDLSGDIYNASGYRYLSGSADAEASYADPKPMTVTLGKGAKLTGDISLSRAVHVWMDWVEDSTDTQGGYYAYRTEKKGESGEGEIVTDANGNNYVQATGFTIDNYYNLGHVINETGAFAEGATADVALTDDAIWTLTGDSYLTSLSVSGDAKIVAPDGGTITLTVDGNEVASAVEITAADAAALTGALKLTVANAASTPSGEDISTPPVTQQSGGLNVNMIALIVMIIVVVIVIVGSLLTRRRKE